MIFDVEKWMLKEGLAENEYAAHHIAVGLGLENVRAVEAKMALVRRYRRLRKAGLSPAAAFEEARKGTEPAGF